MLSRCAAAEELGGSPGRPARRDEDAAPHRRPPGRVYGTAGEASIRWKIPKNVRRAERARNPA